MSMSGYYDGAREGCDGNVEEVGLKMKVAVVTGAGGQDGSYLCELLVAKGYQVWGLLRPSGNRRYANLRNLEGHPNFNPIFGDLLNKDTIIELACKMPDEFYHLGALSHVGQSFHHPTLSLESTAMVTANVLEALLRFSPKTKVYIASTSEMLSSDGQMRQIGNEESPLNAHSPYAAGKVCAHLLGKVYREAFGMFVVSGISYNHESRRRGRQFVTKKIAEGVREYWKGGVPVELGRLDVSRDWHHAQDTVMGMWLAMQHEYPDEYVFASGVSRTVEDFARDVCGVFAVDFHNAIVSKPEVVEARPWDVDYLCGDPQKAEQLLGWERRYNWQAMVEDVCQEWPR